MQSYNFLPITQEYGFSHTQWHTQPWVASLIFGSPLPFSFFLFPCSLFTQTAALSCVCDFDWESIISLPLDLHSFLALLVVFLFSSIEDLQEVNFNCRPGVSTTLLVLLAIRRWQSRQSSTRWSYEMRFCHITWGGFHYEVLQKSINPNTDMMNM